MKKPLNVRLFLIRINFILVSIKFNIKCYVNGQFQNTKVQNKSLIERILGSIKEFYKVLYFQFLFIDF
jgi:hypothetical protein